MSESILFLSAITHITTTVSRATTRSSMIRVGNLQSRLLCHVASLVVLTLDGPYLAFLEEGLQNPVCSLLLEVHLHCELLQRHGLLGEQLQRLLPQLSGQGYLRSEIPQDSKEFDALN